MNLCITNIKEYVFMLVRFSMAVINNLGVNDNDWDHRLIVRGDLWSV